MNNILQELETWTEVLGASMKKSKSSGWARISIVVTSSGFYPMVNGKAVVHSSNDCATIEEAMALIHREVNRIAQSEDLLAKTLGIEVAA